jgi:hypothetical protein
MLSLVVDLIDLQVRRSAATGGWVSGFRPPSRKLLIGARRFEVETSEESGIG